MASITVLSMITLDGVMQSPGTPIEDTENQFSYGGWVAPFDDETYGEVMAQELQPASYLLGRKTYEIWAAYWPTLDAFWPAITEGTKYVFSNTLNMNNPLVTSWKNTVIINTIDQIKALKKAEGPNIQLWGSSQLAQLLFQHDLVDELRLKIHPVVLGKGKKLFHENAFPSAFSLTESIVTTKGVIIASYHRSGQVKTGTIGE